MSDVTITEHAIERFRLRHCPDETLVYARLLLEKLVARSEPLREKTFNGDEQWQVRSPDCVFVVKRDVGDFRRRVVVTVLPKREGDGLEEEELEDFRRYVETNSGIARNARDKATKEAMMREQQLARVDRDSRQRNQLHAQLIAAEKKCAIAWAEALREFAKTRPRT